MSATFIPSTSIAGAGQHSSNTCHWIVLPRVSRCRPTSYTWCRPTYPIPVKCWAIVAAHCWFNADKLSTTLAQHYSNTGSAVYLAAASQQTCAIHPIPFQFWPDVFDTGPPTLKQNWMIVPCLVWLPHYNMRVTLSTSRRQKSHYPDNTLPWPNTDVMLGHRLWRWANIIPALSLMALITKI